MEWACALWTRPLWGSGASEQQFVIEDLADPVTVELVTSTQHKVSLKRVIDWMAPVCGKSFQEVAMKARAWDGLTGTR
jgi:hypothetical protein